MKKILIVLMLIATPAFATCSIEKPCEISMDNNNITIQQQKNIEKSRIKRNKKLYHSKNEKQTLNNNTNNYNANCQFGICLPKLKIKLGK